MTATDAGSAAGRVGWKRITSCQCRPAASMICRICVRYAVIVISTCTGERDYPMPAMRGIYFQGRLWYE